MRIRIWDNMGSVVRQFDDVVSYMVDDEWIEVKHQVQMPYNKEWTVATYRYRSHLVDMVEMIHPAYSNKKFRTSSQGGTA